MTVFLAHPPQPLVKPEKAQLQWRQKAGRLWKRKTSSWLHVQLCKGKGSSLRNGPVHKCQQHSERFWAISTQVQPFSKLEREDSGYMVHLCHLWFWVPISHHPMTESLHCLQAIRKRKIQVGNRDFSGFFSGDHTRGGGHQACGVLDLPWK